MLRHARDLVAVERGTIEERRCVALQLIPVVHQLAETELRAQCIQPAGIVTPCAARRDDDRRGGRDIELLGEVAVLALAGVAQKADVGELLHVIGRVLPALAGRTGRGGGRGRLTHGGEQRRPGRMGRSCNGRRIVQTHDLRHQVILDSHHFLVKGSCLTCPGREGVPTTNAAAWVRWQGLGHAAIIQASRGRQGRGHGMRGTRRAIWAITVVVLVAATAVFGGSGVISPAGAGPAHRPVIFVHGFAGSGSQFEAQAMRFTSNGYSPDDVAAHEYDSLFGTESQSDVLCTTRRAHR